MISNVPRQPDRLVDRSALVQRLWSAKFVLSKIARSFRTRRTDGLLYQRLGYEQILQAEQDWNTLLQQFNESVVMAKVYYNGLHWEISGKLLDERKLHGGTVSLSKPAGRTHKEWKAWFDGENPNEVRPQLTPMDAVGYAIAREQSRQIRQEGEGL
jgi:hypothetical protein